MISYYKIKVIRVRYLLTYAFGEDQSLQKEECNKINHINMVRGKKYILKLINKCNISSHNCKKNEFQVSMVIKRLTENIIVTFSWRCISSSLITVYLLSCILSGL